MDQYLYVLIIAMSIFFCPFCFISWEISVLPKLKKCFKKKENNNNLNESLIDN